MPKAIIIKPNEAPVVKEVTDVKAELDGGWLEGLTFNDGTIAYVDEEGKMKGLPVNELATRICRTFNVGLNPDDVIVGTFILCGTLDENGIHDGDEHDVSDLLVEQIVDSNAWGQGKTQ
jgi:hypothetical protein|tara:strand:+ start:275 stop:631 length:357 start_codon:yes stop_codon:yes gene_type:complete